MIFACLKCSFLGEFFVCNFCRFFDSTGKIRLLAITLGLVFLGGAVVPGIPTDVLPDFKTPVVVSFFSYPGLPTLDMEKSVTSRVERALTLAGKLDKQESRTLPGASVLKITFQPGTDASSAMNDMPALRDRKKPCTTSLAIALRMALDTSSCTW